MRKPNTSVFAALKPRLCDHLLRHRLSRLHVANGGHTRREGGPSRRTDCCRPASPSYPQHWMKERPESLQAIHTDLSLLR